MSSDQARKLSETFDQFDSMLSHEVSRINALTEENAHLRELLVARSSDSPNPRSSATFASTSSAPSPSPDTATLLAELKAARHAQEEMARELKALKDGHGATHDADDHSSELFLLRSSLATLASELEAEKNRVRLADERRRQEEEKVSTLRSKVEESRRALMRIQGESTRKQSVDLGGLQPRRQSMGLLDSQPRRRSSLGLSQAAGGLGFFVDSAGIASSSSKVSPLGRNLAHRRGSASIHSISPDNRDEDDRLARLRDLRLGLTTTKIASRRGSLAQGEALGEFDYEPEKRRIPSFSFPSGSQRSHSISEESDDSIGSRPPSAPLRFAGRKQSMAVFDDFSSRRSSTDSASGYYSSPGGLAAPFQVRSLSTGPSSPTTAELMNQLQGLRIQLAESEEGRRASEHCLRVLKEYIATSPADGLSLPPLPTDSETDSPSGSSSKRSASVSSRWSIPLLNIGAGSRRESASASPNLTAFTPRRASNASTFSNSASYHDKPTPSANAAPIFGAFSFSNLVSPDAPLDDGETSPTGGHRDVFPNTELELEAPVDVEVSPSTSDDVPSEAESAFHSRAPSLTDSSCSESSRSSSPEAGSPVLMNADLVKIFGTTAQEQSGAGGLGLAPALLVDGKALSDPTTPTFTFGVAE